MAQKAPHWKKHVILLQQRELVQTAPQPETIKAITFLCRALAGTEPAGRIERVDREMTHLAHSA
jgi:hypothetical protein